MHTIWTFNTETRRSATLVLEYDVQSNTNTITKTEIDREGKPFGSPKVVDTFKGLMDDESITRLMKQADRCLVAQSFVELQISILRWNSVYGLPNLNF